MTLPADLASLLLTLAIMLAPPAWALWRHRNEA